MWKLIVKNLWARRRRNGWLLAELILIGIICWVVFDPIVVLTHDRRIPLGYDADRLCLVSLGGLQLNAPGYDAQATDSASVMDAYFRLVRLAGSYDEVESVAPILSFCFPNSDGSGSTGLAAEGDSVQKYVAYMNFLPHTRFFETYGFRPGQGMTPKQLSDYNYTQHDVVLSADAARYLFDTADATGRRCFSAWSGDTTRYTVTGTVGSFKAYSEWRPTPVLFLPMLKVNASDIPEDAHILMRLKPGVSMEHFLHDFRPRMVREMRNGNLFALTVSSYNDIIARREASGSAPVYRRNVALAVFFLVNLCLGVAGTFWLQTRTRREEVGVLLSFGGTRGYIVRLLMGEGVVLTTVAVLVACFLYLLYALSEGLYAGMTWMEGSPEYWVSDFAWHFFGMSVLIYLVLLSVVLAGIYIPARSISRVPPTEALRDE